MQRRYVSGPSARANSRQMTQKRVRDVMNERTSGSAPIPYLDLSRQNDPIYEELLSAVARVAGAQSFVLGRVVREFEEAIAEYIGVRHAIGVASGTDALYLALRASALEPGDEVITSPFTFFATAGAIENAGLRIVFCDIEPTTFNLDPDSIAEAITDRTRAIIPVHLYGQMAAMEPLVRLADERGLSLIEDAAQAIGAKGLVENQWRPAGGIGALGCFSFYPTKNLGGWGDGGVVTTNDDTLADRVRRLRVHGQNQEDNTYVHEAVGINSRLDAIQAAVLNVKLQRLPGWTEMRRARAAMYDQKLGGLGRIVTPRAEHDRYHVYNLYTIRVEGRDDLRRSLAERGIGSGVYYPLPLHMQPCFAHLGYGEGDFPESEKASREVLSLPLYPELAPDEIDRVVRAVEEFVGAA